MEGRGHHFSEMAYFFYDFFFFFYTIKMQCRIFSKEVRNSEIAWQRHNELVSFTLRDPIVPFLSIINWSREDDQ